MRTFDLEACWDTQILVSLSTLTIRVTLGKQSSLDLSFFICKMGRI